MNIRIGVIASQAASMSSSACARLASLWRNAATAALYDGYIGAYAEFHRHEYLHRRGSTDAPARMTGPAEPMN